jgi:hypothetical protein
MKRFLLVIVLICLLAAAVAADEGPSVIRIEHIIREDEVRGSSYGHTVTIKHELINTKDLVLIFKNSEAHNAPVLIPITSEPEYQHILISDGQIRFSIRSPEWVEIPSQHDSPVGSTIVIFIVKATQFMNE